MEKNTLNNSQYKTDENLNARALIHEKYSTNKTPWHKWVFKAILLEGHKNILELGCGNGLLWIKNADIIPGTWNMTLTDYSDGMLQAAKENLKDINMEVEYKNVNVENIPYGNETFDCIITNHMLYHVDNRIKALNEIGRVLHRDGFFYASAAGMKHMHEMKKMVNDFLGNTRYEEVISDVENNFSLENGKEQLLEVFDKVDLLKYDDSLEINEPELIVNYVLSFNDIKPGVIVLDPSRKDNFYAFIAKQIKKEKTIRIQKHMGLFICRK
ncbi:MAG: class I SAM-dependent methyltransferase [Actinomycetota bacterium]|nr:class I SAM-dependent methyltransferase [Actinomycetota bacterium]